MKCFKVFSPDCSTYFGHTRGLTRFVAFAFVLAMSMTACMKPTTRSADPNNNFDPSKPGMNQSAATFFTTEVTGSASVSMNLDGFTVPTEKLFNFKTCVQDKRTQETIKGHKFNVTGAPGQIIIANNGRSDESGCVNWSEKLRYNGAGDAKYLPIRRTLVADGMHTGARDLDICINPWVEGTEAVKDCLRRAVPSEQLAKVEDIPNILKGQSVTGEKLERRLWINDMRLNSTHNPGGTQFGMIDFSVSMGPKILRYNIRGEEDPLPLADGVFGMEFWIIAKTGDANNKCYVIAKSGAADNLKMVAGRLQNEMKMKVQYLSTYGQLELVGSIQPKENSLNISTFNGLWMLGDHTGLLGMKFAFERPATYKGEPGAFDARKYAASCDDVSGGTTMAPTASSGPVAVIPTTVAAAPGATATVDGKVIVAPDLMTNDCVDAPDIARLFPEDSFAKDFKGGTDLLSCINKNLPSGITRLEQFEFGLVDVRPEPIIDPLSTETTTERTIKYRVTTRVTNPLAQGAPLRDIEFMVEKSDGSVDPIRTNHLGDLIFTDKIHHVYFAPERYMLKVIRIRHKSGFTKRLAIVFNPWDNNGFTFARDIRGMTKQTVAQVNLVPRPRSELLLTQFQWGTQGFRYEVDDFLNLKMYKQFNLSLTPRVLRYSSLTEGRMKNEPLRDGIYLMKVAIQKDYRPIDGDALEFVTATRKLVRVASGQIITPIEMAFRDFRILKLRSNLMIEITTIDEAKLSPTQRKTLIFDGPLDSLIEKNSGLPSRTFVGPVVAYSNGFSSSMRPSDDLSESFCKTIDCDELKKNDKIPPSELAEEAKFFGSIRHLANKTVGSVESPDSMITRLDKIEKQYKSLMTATARLSRLLQDGNYEYGAVFNEPSILAQDPLLPKNNVVLTPGNAFADLVKRMSSIDGYASFSSSALEPFAAQYRALAPKPALDVAAFKEILFGNKPMTKEIAARLCVVFIEDLILQRTAKQEESLSYLDRVKARMSRLTLSDECMRQLSNSSSGILNLERKIRVFALADSERRGGTLMSLGVGAGSAYSMSRSQSFTYGWSPTSAVSGLLKVAGLGIAEKFLDVFGVGVNISRSDSKSISQDTSVDTKQSISVEMRGMRLTLGQYERCASIKLSQNFIEEQFPIINRALPANLNLLDKVNRMRRGLFLCEGAVSKTPIQVDERYYQFSQMLGEEVMNDPTALENHPYLITTLRSRADFARMVRMIEARPLSLSDLPGHINIGEVPIQRLMQVFKTPMPMFPGVLTLEPDTIVQEPVIHKQ